MKASVSVTQTANDTTTAGTVNLPTLDQKSAYSIKAVRARWSGASVAPGDWTLDAILATVSTAVTLTDAEYIGSVSWGLQNTGGVAVVNGFDPIKFYQLPEPRVTVQDLSFLVVSSSTQASNTVILEVFYDIIKLSEMEYLRLLAGGV